MSDQLLRASDANPDREIAVAEVRALEADMKLGYACALVLYNARDLAGADNLTLAGELDRSLARADELARSMPALPSVATSVARARGRAASVVRDLDRAATRDLDRHLARSHVHFYVKDIVVALIDAQRKWDLVVAAFERVRVESAYEVDQPSVSPDAASNRVQESKGALRLIELTVACLPARHRSRYCEEFSAQLVDLATRSRRAQWHFALGTLSTIWTLRHELCRGDRAPAPGRWPS